MYINVIFQKLLYFLPFCNVSNILKESCGNVTATFFESFSKINEVFGNIAVILRNINIKKLFLYRLANIMKQILIASVCCH